MLLSAGDIDRANHQYAYTRVIDIYHVNVIYTGSGASDYRARRHTVWLLSPIEYGQADPDNVTSEMGQRTSAHVYIVIIQDGWADDIWSP
jgi:hypothetical protein